MEKEERTWWRVFYSGGRGHGGVDQGESGRPGPPPPLLSRQQHERFQCIPTENAVRFMIKKYLFVSARRTFPKDSYGMRWDSIGALQTRLRLGPSPPTTNIKQQRNSEAAVVVVVVVVVVVDFEG
jgi:hypothetical protein